MEGQLVGAVEAPDEGGVLLLAHLGDKREGLLLLFEGVLVRRDQPHLQASCHRRALLYRDIVEEAGVEVDMLGTYLEDHELRLREPLHGKRGRCAAALLNQLGRVGGLPSHPNEQIRVVVQKKYKTGLKR